MAAKVVKEEVIRVRVNKELKNRLKEMCKDKKNSMSELIIYMIENEINKYEFKIRNRKEIEDRVKVIDKKIDGLKHKKNWY
ncbi:CopG family transcriptional regulator [Clostridium sp.]|uniref:CopG family transcriptional regulator n=1 Tax=Clostridium sp. TaxID=1506 RepID=UPI0025BCA61F|nr:CopG family transcriptional regulator [Clostridium sp.]HDO9489911.1 CopG family transcriptional regulator [Clostridioides difficile]